MAESKEELTSLLMKVKEESEKSWLKTHHSKNEDLFTSLQGKQRGVKMETVTDFILGASKITVDGEIKRGLLLERKAMTNLDSI